MAVVRQNSVPGQLLLVIATTVPLSCYNTEIRPFGAEENITRRALTIKKLSTSTLIRQQQLANTSKKQHFHNTYYTLG